MILALLTAATVASAQPACPDTATPQAFVCRALEASKADRPADAAAAFEQAAGAADNADPSKAFAFAAAGNMWIVAKQPGKAALALDRALALPGLQAEQRGMALLDRARAAEMQNDLKAARARLKEAEATVAADPFYWYFSAALAIRENDKATAQTSINRALSLAPTDPTILFEAGHVAQFAGDEVGARDYWTRAAAADPTGATGKAAREALAMMPARLTVKAEPTTSN